MKDMLLSKSEWKILNIFLENPWKKLYTREIIRLSCVGPNTAIKILKNLEKIGIFSSTKSGNLIQYNINNNEFVKRLLFLHHEKKIANLAEEFKIYINRIRDYSKKEKIISIVLFGSVAKENADKLSDIDILIIHENKFDKDDQRNLFNKYPREVQIVDFERKEFASKYIEGNELIINIIKSGIIVYDREFYHNYLFKPVPKPSKKYIRGILQDVEKKLDEEWKIFRENREFVSPSIYLAVNKVSTAMVIINGYIPESKKDIEKKLTLLDEKRLFNALKTARKVWNGDIINMSREDIESVLTLVENKIKECYVKLEEY